MNLTEIFDWIIENSKLKLSDEHLQKLSWNEQLFCFLMFYASNWGKNIYKPKSVQDFFFLYMEMQVWVGRELCWIENFNLKLCIVGHVRSKFCAQPKFFSDKIFFAPTELKISKIQNWKPIVLKLKILYNLIINRI